MEKTNNVLDNLPSYILSKRVTGEFISTSEFLKKGEAIRALQMAVNKKKSYYYSFFLLFICAYKA
jgi:hypothetical protein